MSFLNIQVFNLCPASIKTSQLEEKLSLNTLKQFKAAQQDILKTDQTIEAIYFLSATTSLGLMSGSDGGEGDYLCCCLRSLSLNPISRHGRYFSLKQTQSTCVQTTIDTVD